MAQVRHVVLVLSGKGGVGKSTITTELALALRHAGKKVSCELCANAGPALPSIKLLGEISKKHHFVFHLCTAH